MNWRQIKFLFGLNLLYVNQQSTLQLRKKKEKKPSLNIIRSLVSTYLLTALILLVLAGVGFYFIDLVRMPGYFTMLGTMITLLSLSGGFTNIYNIFYESGDFKHFLPMPVKSSSVFTAKLFTAAYVLLPYSIPILALFLMTSIRAGVFIVFAILIALAAFILFYALMLVLSVAFITLVAQTKLFQRFKKVFTTLLMIVPLLLLVVGYAYMMYGGNGGAQAAMQDKIMIPVFYPLYMTMTQPLSAISLIGLGVEVLLLLFLIVLLAYYNIPKMFRLLIDDKFATAAPKTAKNRKAVSYGSFSTLLFRYNIGLLRNPSLWVQTIIGFVMMPIILIFTAQGFKAVVARLPLQYLVFAWIVGIALSATSTTPSTIGALIISMDKENFTYIKSLPIAMRYYLAQKFKLALLIQMLLSLAEVLAIGFIVGLGLPMFAALVLGNLLGILVFSQLFFARDYRYLSLTWMNISELFNRKGGNVITFIMAFGGIVIGAGAAVGISYLFNWFPAFTLWISFGFIGLTVVGIAIALAIYRNRFWKKLV